ncbi:V-set and immunoglobulin domain-containing protein 8 [Ambystoma mexicanum]|uniref:V-set and immunoglobulin domain-containing protein 8 n=1 Tax=Ambystoma mexicanum TaxID=8296 RepID=UPI0037E789CF
MGSRRLLVLLLLGPVLVSAVTIKEQSTETMFKSKGDTLVVPCTYTLDPSETGNLDIEWVLMNPDPRGLDTVILIYMDNEIIQKGPQELMQRLRFTAVNPGQADASITITYLEVKDSGTYYCKVKKNPGVASRKVTINVAVLPVRTQCSVNGEQFEGHDVTLKCKPEEGSPPLSFKWEKLAGDNPAVPPTITLANTNGDLFIRNISQAIAGTYKCTVVNKVGHDECTVVLSAAKEENRAGIIAGAVIGAILLLLLLLLLIWCLICCCNRRRYEKELANEIKEDMVAPPSNNNSRASSVRTAIGYRPHHISYSLRRDYKEEPKGMASAPPLLAGTSMPTCEDYEDDDLVTTVPGPTRLSPYNISRIGGVPVMVPAQAREGFLV